MYKIVFLRHGESIWNKENKFTGWTDVDLSKKGIKECIESGKIMKRKGYTFDYAFTSVLKRGIRTLWLVQDVMDLMWIPVRRSWRLNERHYGALQGFNKAAMARKVGEEQVFKWRRSYAIRPPALKKSDKRYPGNQLIYKDVPKKDLPVTESLKDTVKRCIPYWHSHIVPMIKKKKKIIVSAHGNSLRALVKYLDKIPDKDVPNLNIPTGIPLVYELNKKMKPIRHYYLGNPKKVKKATAHTASVGIKK